MKAQHTPGPWKAADCLNHALAIEGPKYEWPGQQPHAVRYAPATTVAVVYMGDGGSYTHYPDQTAQANARLIAAAPELLEALELAYAEVKAWRAGLNTRRNPAQGSKVGACYATASLDIPALIRKAKAE